MSKHLAITGRKNSPLTGSNLQQNQAQGSTAICCDQLGMRGEKQDKRQTVKEQKINKN